MNNKRIESVDFLKLIAILLIMNSHFDSLYPNAAFATGGSAGNSLFFIIAGYLVSYQENFKKWFSKKIVKLFLPIFIVNLFVIDKILAIDSIRVFVHRCIWPNDFWFFGAITLFYLLFHLLSKYKLINKKWLITSVVAVMYIVCYIFFQDTSYWSVESTYIRYIYYFYIFILGYWIKNMKINNNEAACLSYAAIMFILSILVKYLMSKGMVGFWLQFSTQILNIVFAYFALSFALSFENRYCEIFNIEIRNLITSISSRSFEMYVVQFSIIRFCESIIFPINAILAVILTIIFAFILRKVCDRITNLFIKNI